MIKIDEAEKIVSDFNVKTEIEEVSLLDSLNRILAQDIVSQINMPPFDKSAMDGYAVNSNDSSKKFNIVETIAAGTVPKKAINRGECTKIMTGAMLPKGANKVVIKEVTEEKYGFMYIIEKKNELNICYQGEDVKEDDVVLKSGILLRPVEIGVIASMGIKFVKVYNRPVVGILTTGSEIVEPGEKLKSGQIYNSNAYSITTQIFQIGGDIKYGGIASDNKEELKNQIFLLLSETDMVVISGGVSMGDYDFVPEILEDLGVKLHFTKVAIKPGKPTVFGSKGEKVIFGLPGNPVSTFVIFEVFIKPFLYRMMGHNYNPLFLKGIMEKKFKRKKSIRSFFVPAKYTDGYIKNIEYHGSAHLNALSQANCLLQIPAGVQELQKGAEVYVRQI